MSFVLQLDTVAATDEETENNDAPILSKELTNNTSLPIGMAAATRAAIISSDEMTKINNSVVQDATNVCEISTGHLVPTTSSPVSIGAMKSIGMAYPVVKTTKESRKVTGSITDTTQVMTTRVVSQKLPSSVHQSQSGTPQMNPSVTHLLAKSQSLSSSSGGVGHVFPLQTTASSQNANSVQQHPKSQSTTTCEVAQSKQQSTQIANAQTKVQSVSGQQILTSTAVKAITTGNAMTNIHRIHVKTPNVVGQPQTMNLQKVKTITNVGGNQFTAVQRNSFTRIKTMQKSQALTSNAQNSQFAVNQVVNNVNVQRMPHSVAQGLQKGPIMSTANSSKAQQVYSNQKIQQQSLGSHLNHKTQQQQQHYQGNQQVQQTLQKLQNPSQKTLAAQRQQVSLANNVQKPAGNSVASIQKTQAFGLTQTQQQVVHAPKNGQPVQTSQQQRTATTTTLQKSQTLASINTNKSQTITNICKSNSVSNITKLQQNSNMLNVGNQQLSQQIHLPSNSQLQQQLLPSQQQQIVQKQQQGNVTSSGQRVGNVHQKITTIANISNNQRAQTAMNSKGQQQQIQQQQMLLRVGVPKNQPQNVQQANQKTLPQKILNIMKQGNSPNAVQQQSVHRNNNSQPVKIVQQQQQQQQQHIIGPQNAQKQPGCIKTIPPQKSGQKSHTQKTTNVKTSANASVNTPKGLSPTTVVTPKTSIKTLLPQQATAPNMLVHKNPSVKIQQQAIQQKQLVIASQYPSQVRPQTGQIKTLLPVSNTEPRKDVENKIESECQAPVEEEEEISEATPKSPVKRMPLPYECLQFVLQDHNYGAPPPRTPPPPSPPPSHPKQQPINGAGSSTASSQHPFIFSQAVAKTPVEDDATSVISSEAGREVEPEGEETETAPEGEGDDEDSVTRCICDFEHDDGYMICCDRCLVWQHVDCMGIDRSNIPDEYLCEICRPRRVDRQRARALQMRKREELLNSDTSSDTSSTSSADTDAGVSQKKRPLQVQRRKSEPQVRRLNNNNNNNNNNVAKRQRRDTHPRQSSAVRKKEATKRGPGKRKIKRRMSVDDKEEDVQDAWGTNMAPLRQWIERYEEAVTNHYSPELRARISSIKINGTHNDLRQSNMNAIATGKCRLNVHSNNLRFLVATMYLPPNTPVVELRGKYMLSTQHRPSHPQGRQHVQRPGPFVFFYRLPRDGTEVCVDTRTYGNDARFVRRSCKPNAEVKHCIEKGTLHLYIVSTTAIEKNAEITIKHEQHDLLLSPNPSSPALPVLCACNNPRECQFATTGQFTRRGNTTPLAENADGRERRRRGRRNTICEDSEPSPNTTTTTTVTPQTPTVTSVPVTVPPRKTITNTVSTTPKQAPKEETPIAVPQPETSPNLTQSTTQETKKDKKKMTREERKMEAIMKAFERLEKAEQRKQEVQARNAQRKESGGTHSDNEESHVSALQAKSKQQITERQIRRKRRKGRARSTSTSQSHSSRRTRLNSADSDLSSGDESNSMQSPPLLNQNLPSNRESSYLHSQAKMSNDVGATGTSNHQGIPTAAGLLLALANSNAPGPSSPPLQQPTPAKSPTCDSGASSSSQSSTPSTPLSSACLLVAAAVGPLAPGFKFPKTKKVLMNEWLKESPDLPPTNMSQVSPLPALPSTPLSNSVNSLCRPSELSLPTDPSAEFLSQSYAAKSLATLVQAANSVSGICDSPPQKRQGVSGSTNTCPVSTGSAKKRWLRQAISEECDSPNSRPDSPPTGETVTPHSEMVAPPKKRRIARESLSSDNYTPPTTPTMLLPEPTSINRSMSSNEDDFMEHPQSPTMEHSDEQDYEMDKTEDRNFKTELKSEIEPMECDDQQTSSFNLCRNGDLELKRETNEIENLLQTRTCKIKTEDNVIKKEDFAEEEEEEEDEKTNCDFTLKDLKMLDNKLCVEQESQNVQSVTQDVRDIETVVKKEAAIKKELPTVVEKGTVEIIDQHEPDTEMEDFSSPIATMESDAILKQRVAEMRLEFGGGIADVSDVENEKSEDTRKSETAKYEENLDDDMSFDEFDVEAQMKKITGDDGNDYKEKIDTSSEKDKSMDGIEGLMESSKEDSESEDKDMDDLKYCEQPFKMFNVNREKKFFEEFENTPNQASPVEDKKDDENKKTAAIESQKQQATSFTATSEESMFESTSSNMETESAMEPPKVFHSIPPLSERIRKKVDPSPAPKTQLDIEAAIIESTINMENEDMSKNGEEKSMLSTALRELLEAKLDEETSEVIKSETINKNCVKLVEGETSPSSETTSNIQESPVKSGNQDICTSVAPKEEEAQPKDIVRLKDPRTVVPNSMPAPSAFKVETPPIKRKLSISEYRKRKQQSTGTPSEPEPSSDASASDKGGARGRSDSASSGTSSLSSDEEGSKVSLNLDIPSLTTLPLFANNDNEEKKGGEEGTIGWSAAPTLVERQRENLTERLKREFGLFLSDDEEERARKQGLTAEAILKARKASPSHSAVTNTPPTYPLPHLPPQPYIPPPGSAAMHYSQYPAKSCPVQYPTFTAPQTMAQPVAYPSGSPQTSTSKPAQQFLVPQASQAPPGSNPYPPQFIPPTTAAVPIPKFSSMTPPHGTQAFPATTQQQKPFFTHPAPRS